MTCWSHLHGLSGGGSIGEDEQGKVLQAGQQAEQMGISLWQLFSHGGNLGWD